MIRVCVCVCCDVFQTSVALNTSAASVLQFSLGEHHHLSYRRTICLCSVDLDKYLNILQETAHSLCPVLY